ncbi:M1 family metallopeptidase [Changchengzhania lutea]|uniref:M1 family metallopeptidase n=1 Tax=Changchengzhania lutea TaxID=2049305 RepID=UPI00115CCF1B|nr:M1 family metallopeptidase [Changchengzhania lutea]
MKHLILFIYLICHVFYAQQIDAVDFNQVTAKLDINPYEKSVAGSVTYTFDILKPVDSIFIDAQKMASESVYFNKEAVATHNDGTKLWLIHDFQPSSNNEIRLSYKATPKKAMYFIGWGNPSVGSGQIWTQGQGKYTSNWLPSFDDMNEKLEFDLTVTFDKDYKVIANGKLIEKQINDSTTTWHYDMQQPMSSYLVALAIGNYDKKLAYSKSGIPLEMYYYPEDSTKFEPTYRYTKQIFDFLEEDIGVPYPWQNYKQVPVKDFLYAGMENTSTTIFSDGFVIDSIAFVDKNYVNVNAHELAHQWFGNLVTETSGTHHWLQEGFATYYALLAEKAVFGDDYYYCRLYEYAQELLEQDQAGGSTSLLDPNSSGATFYKKGTWILHLLREKVGDKVFKTAVKNYLLKYQFKNVETDDFINEVERVSGQDLDEFVQDYLINTESFRTELIKRSSEILNIKYPNQSGASFKLQLESSKLYVDWDAAFHGISDFYRVSVFKELMKDTTVDNRKLIRSVLKSKDLKVRQEVAKTMSQMPSELKADYETLLTDTSYVTIEAALFNLWQSFPQERNQYLGQTKGIQGFNDKNIHILWLTLALITEDFELQNKYRYFDELTDYTSPKYGFEIRQNAFQYLAQINACREACQKNLNQATNHHNWRFSKFAKEVLKN